METKPREKINTFPNIDREGLLLNKFFASLKKSEAQEFFPGVEEPSYAWNKLTKAKKKAIMQAYKKVHGKNTFDSSMMQAEMSVVTGKNNYRVISAEKAWFSSLPYVKQVAIYKRVEGKVPGMRRKINFWFIRLPEEKQKQIKQFYK